MPLDIELPRPSPQAITLSGRYVKLEPLSPSHANQLFAASAGAENRLRFEYLMEYPPEGADDVASWIAKVIQSGDPLYSAVIDRSTGRCEGRQALLNIKPEHGSIELGGIYWGPAIARTRAATEATYLHMHYVFDTLGYRRFEWKCNNQNTASKAGATRLGFTFEGGFRQHMVIKGRSRDTAWYSITDQEWPPIRTAFEIWLNPENFDSHGHQKQRLEELRLTA